MKIKMDIETHGTYRQVKSAFVARTKHGYFLEVSTRDKRPDCNCMSGMDKKGAYSGISFFADDGMQSVKVYGEWDAVLYNVRYVATVILLPKDYFKNGTVVAETPNRRAKK